MISLIDVFPDDKICPSSIAAWFNEKKYKVSLCRQRIDHHVENSTSVPVVNSNDFERDAFFEWLGIFTIGGKM